MLKVVKQHGFTIVELLIVIVVIAILAAITIVAYNGIQQSATRSALQTEVSQAVRKAEVFKTTQGSGVSYPTTSTDAGISSSANELSYIQGTDGTSFCVQVTKANVTYYATNTNTAPTAGNCLSFGLLGQWKLNGDAQDSSTNGFNGTTLAAFTPSTSQNGTPGGAMAFSGSNYITVPNDNRINADAQSFSFWVRPTSWATNAASAFITKRASGSASGFFIAYLNSASSLILDCGGTGQRWTTGYAPPLNTWTHIVLTCNLSGTTALFVNGDKQPGSATVNRAGMANGGTVLRLGQDSNGTSLQMNGDLDDVRIYNRTLGDAEVTKLFTSNAQ